MPSKSVAQQHLMQAAEHGADFPMAKKLRGSMSHSQLHDFSVGSEAGKPQHVGKMSDPPPSGPSSFSAAPPSNTQAPPTGYFPSPGGGIASLLKGSHSGVVGSNTNTLRQSGQSELDATRNAMQAARKSSPHKNLGNFLHPRKDGKPHGSPKPQVQSMAHPADCTCPDCTA